jgi:hypothetical protein
MHILLVFSLLLAQATAADPTVDAQKLIRLSPNHEVWIDKVNKRVILGGQIALREGQLEMFACLAKTKEHESVVAVNSKAFLVHAGLVAVGAEPGHPAQFRPVYRSASGTEVEITAYWTDDQGKRQQIRAQEWLKNVKTGKPMTENWVFAGSGYWTDRETGQKYYQAEEGDFICVSNFATAMLDVPIESSATNDALLFEANSAKIPERGRRVTLVLTPKLKDLPPQRGDDPKVDLLPKPNPPVENAPEKK